MSTESLPSDAVVVVGAGISGVACARRLTEAGLRVVVLDRGRGPGGRMATRRVTAPHGEHVVDVGASYFVPRDEGFARLAHDWRLRGLARPWTDTLTTIDPGGTSEKQGPTRWAAASGLRSLVTDLAAGLDVRRVTVSAVSRTAAGPAVDGSPVRAVVLAVPDPQALRLLDDSLDSHRQTVADRPWDPVLALWAAWPSRWWAALDAAFVNGSDVLSFVADDGRRRGNDAPVLVAHSTPIAARRHLEAPEEAAGPLLAELGRLLAPGVGVPAPSEIGIQRWTFARPSQARPEPFHLHDGVGLCGDGWGPRPGVEQAWLSGRHLAEVLAADLAGRVR